MLWNSDPWFVKTREAAKRAENAGDTREAERLHRSLYEKAMEKGERETIHEAWLKWIYFLKFSCRYEEALIESERLLEELGQKGDPQIRTQVLVHRAGSFYYLNEYEKAVNIIQRILSESGSDYPPRLMAEAYNVLGLSERHLGMYDEAIEHLDEALLTVRNEGLEDDGMYDGNMALVYEDQGRLNEALASYEVSLDKAVRLGNEEMIVFAEMGKGFILHHLGRFGEARTALESALGKAERMENTMLIQNADTALADLAMEEGNLVLALDHITAALLLAQEAKTLEVEAEALIIHGWIRLDRREPGDSEQAIESARRALAIYGELGLEHEKADALALEAASLLEMGKKEEALDKALEATKTLEPEALDAEMVPFTAARALQAAGRTAEALKMLENARKIVMNKALKLADTARVLFLARPRNRKVLEEIIS